MFTFPPYGSAMASKEMRKYIDNMRKKGYTVRDDDGAGGGDPDLVGPDGDLVNTWKEDYPYDKRMTREDYDVEKWLLQVELLKFQNWAQDTGTRHVILFEGRDAAGKGGAIKRFLEHMDPRKAKVIALPKPNDREETQWYFQRWVSNLPAAGELALFDRSWYTRANVERVMGFCDNEQYERFMRQVPLFEQMLVDEGLSLTKLWFSVTQQEQLTRFAIRQIDPVRQWKLSPMDLKSLDRWDDYTAAKEEMFRRTDTELAPWWVINANDKKRARINAMRVFLSQFDYEGKDPDIVLEPDSQLVMRGKERIATN